MLYIEAVASVLLQEAGHYVDSRINDLEAPGDEGAIFSALVRTESLSKQELQRHRAEDDSATITLDGQTIQIEQATFTGTNGDDTLPRSKTGNGGNDTFNPLRGSDTVDGGAGTDVLVMNYSANTYTGNDYTPGIESYVYLSTNGGFDGSFYAHKDNSYDSDEINFSNIERFQITGTTYGDSINGGGFNDTLNGGGGNDLLVGGFSNDTLTGGAGNDRFTFNAFNEGIDTIVDFGTVDNIYVSAAGFEGGLVANNAAIAAVSFWFGGYGSDKQQAAVYVQHR